MPENQFGGFTKKGSLKKRLVLCCQDREIIFLFFGIANDSLRGVNRESLSPRSEKPLYSFKS